MSDEKSLPTPEPSPQGSGDKKKEKKKKKADPGDDKKPGTLSTALRRLSIFYLFALVVILAAVLFFFKYVPQNQDELNERGLRVLRRLSTNFIRKQKDVISGHKNLIEKSSAAGFHENFKRTVSFLQSYTAISIPTDLRMGDKNVEYNFATPYIKKNDGIWTMFYPVTVESADHSRHYNRSSTIEMDDFSREVLNARDDIFSNYIVLLDSTGSGQGETSVSKKYELEQGKPERYTVDSISTRIPAREAKHTYYILYDNSDISSGDKLNIDSLEFSQNRTDQSGITDLMISGTKYKVFLSHFDLGSQHLMLAGLIRAEDYSARVKKVPQSFISGCLILITLIFVIIPFIKIFFLSPHEIITAKDVFACTISLFLGTAAVVVVMEFIFLSFTVSRIYDDKLSAIADSVQQGFETELRQAGEELTRYDDKYAALQPGDQRLQVLQYRDHDVEAIRATDNYMLPDCYWHFSRISWIDSAGITVAKWNPFNFLTPLTDVSDQPYYKAWKDRAPKNKTNYMGGFQAVYAGKSDATSEFQVYVVRMSNSFKDGAIVMASSPLCSQYPILPEGFGFCIMDAEGEVLIHSDRRRNLSENFLEETGENPTVENCVINKNSMNIRGVSLYGHSHTVTIRPVKDQPLSLAVFYESDFLAGNIFRSILFSIQTLCYIFLGIAAVIIAYLLTGNKPPMLRFQIQKTEWIRPLFCYDFYRYAKKAFLFLTALTLAFFIRTMLVSDDLSPLLYISLLLPFNCLSMYISLRRASERLGTMAIIVIALVVVSTVIFQLISSNAGGNPSDWKTVFRFEMISFIALAWFSFEYLSEITRKEPATPADRKEKFRKSIRDYNYAAMLSIILIAALPAIGIISFTVQSEKYQIKKSMALAAARNFEKRIDWVQNKRPDYKEDIRITFSMYNHFDEDGIYLGGADFIRPGSAANEAKPNPIADKPYCSLLDRNISYLNPGSLQSLSIPDKAKDGSWTFGKTDSATLILHYDLPVTDSVAGANQIIVETPVHKTFADFFFNQPPMQWILWILIAGMIIYFSAGLLRACLDRLFFFDYIVRYDTEPDENALKGFFTKSSIAPKTTTEDKAAPPGQEKESHQDKKESTHLTLAKPPIELFREEEWVSPAEKENTIFNNTEKYKSQYEAIWKSLDPEEQYVLYDFSQDRYTNYKLLHVLMSLIKKGVLTVQDNRVSVDFFALSFRNYVLSKKNSKEILVLQKEWAVPGTWESMKIPILSMVGAAAIFLILTQGEFTQKVSGILTSIAALLPLIFRLFDRKTT